MSTIFDPRLRTKLLLLGLVILALGILVLVGSRRGQAQYGPATLPQTGEGYGEARVSASSLNLRTGPHTSYTAVAYLMEGEEVRLVGRNRTGTWVKIALYNGYLGWVNASYIRPTIDIAALPIADVDLWGITAFVTNDPIPVYTGADAGFGLVGWARPGDILALDGRNDATTWVHVRLPNGYPGWARADSSFLPSGTLNDLPILTPFLDAPPPYMAPYFVVYTGPGFLYEPVDSVAEGQTLGIIGRTEDSHWVQVRLANGREGWIAAEIIHVSASLANVPVVHGIAAPQVVGWQASSSAGAGGQSPTPTIVSTGTGKIPIAPTATTDPQPAATEPSPTVTPAATTTMAATTIATTPPAATATAAATEAATLESPPLATTTPDPDATGEAAPPGLPIVYVYATPDDSTTPILRVVPGQSVVLVGRTEDAEWVKIWLPGGQEGWIRAEALQLEMDVSVLPVVEP